MPTFEELPAFRDRTEPKKTFGEAANDARAYAHVGRHIESETLRIEEQAQADYARVIEIFTALKKLAGDKVFMSSKEPIPKEWEGELERLNRAFRAILLNEGVSEEIVREQFERMLYRRNFDTEIARYTQYAVEAKIKIAEEKIRLAEERVRLQEEADRQREIQATPERFHGPLDGPETRAVV